MRIFLAALFFFAIANLAPIKGKPKVDLRVNYIFSNKAQVLSTNYTIYFFEIVGASLQTGNAHPQVCI